MSAPPPALDAMIFDLDGTLVQTEKLKADSYAAAAQELNPEISPETVVEAFTDVVGGTRRDVATHLLERFDLEGAARDRMPELDVDEPWRAYVQIRLRIYEERVADPEVLRAHRWTHTGALLDLARATCQSLGLATSSQWTQARHVLRSLDLLDAFDAIATDDDVERSKPDPEIYLLVADQLRARPARCLVLEDSPTGVRAALAAGMEVVAIATPFTRARLHALETLGPGRIVDEPGDLLAAVSSAIARILGSGGPG